jgi:polysaccharide export outer membrane protein
MKINPLLNICFIIAIILASSCTSQKELLYLRNLDTIPAEQFFPYQQPDYRIQKRDILYIRFFTLNDELNEILNTASSRYTANMFQNETSLYINGYTVNDSGKILLPLMGEIQVTGLTVDEATKAIQNKTNDFLKDGTVVVKLISFKVTVIGEVNRPGSYTNFNNQLTVLEAIGMAGDISDFGNRKKVLVVRPTPEGTKTYRMNLQDKSILTSKAFFLLPNDIVIVEPIKSKPFQMNIPTLSLFLNSVSTLILVITFILTIK